MAITRRTLVCPGGVGSAVALLLAACGSWPSSGIVETGRYGWSTPWSRRCHLAEAAGAFPPGRWFGPGLPRTTWALGTRRRSSSPQPVSYAARCATPRRQVDIPTPEPAHRRQPRTPGRCPVTRAARPPAPRCAGDSQLPTSTEQSPVYSPVASATIWARTASASDTRPRFLCTTADGLALGSAPAADRAAAATAPAPGRPPPASTPPSAPGSPLRPAAVLWAAL
jgi:hypothetical protein